MRKNKHGTKLRTLIRKRGVSCHCYCDIKVELRKEEMIESVFGRVGFFLFFIFYVPDDSSLSSDQDANWFLV